MIEIVNFVAGKRHDTAEAVDEAGAITAAEQMVLDAEAMGVFVSKLVTRFYVDGKQVREVRGTVFV